MATVTKAANVETNVTTGWTNEANAFATSGDNVYATATPAKNSTVNGDFGFPAFSTSDIPDGSIIESVDITVEWGMTAAVTGGTLGCFGRNNTSGFQYGPEVTQTSITETQVTIHCQGVTLTDLRTAGELRARIRCTKGNSTSAMDGRLDFVSVTVTYSAPPTTAVPVAATMLRGTGNTATGSISATAGNALFVGGYGYGGSTFTVTRTGDTYTTDTSGAMAAAVATLGIASAPNIAGGAVTMTVSSTSAAPTQAWAAEFSGMLTSGMLDSSAPAIATGSGTTATSPSETNVQADVLFLAFMGCTATPNPALIDVEAGWADVIASTWMGTGNGAADLVSGFAFKVVSTAAAESADWAITSSNWGALTTAYKPDVGGGGTTLTPAAIPIPIVVAAPNLSAVLAPNALAIPIATPAPTLALVIAPAPVATSISVAAPSLVVQLAPVPVSIPIVVAAPSLAIVLAPAPVQMPLVVPTPVVSTTSDTVLTPDPIAVPIVTAAPTLALVVAPAPVATNIAIAQPTLALNIAPAPRTIPIVVAAPTLALQLAPAPIAIPLVVPVHVAAVGGATVLTPAPVAIPLVIAQPTLVVALATQPVQMSLVVATASVALARTVTAQPVSIPLAIPTVGLALGVAPTPVVVLLVVPVATLSLAFQLQPAPVVIPIVVITPSLFVGQVAPVVLEPTPIAIAINALSAYIVVLALNYSECASDLNLPNGVLWPQGVERGTGEETAAELRGCAVPVDVLRPWEI